MNKFTGFLAVLIMMSMTPKTPEKIEEFVPSELDYNGMSLTILHGEDVALFPEEECGLMVSDAQYLAALKTTLQHNVKLESLASENPERMLKNCVLAADYAFDAALGNLRPTMQDALSGFFYDLNKIPELQLNGVWWDSELNGELEQGGMLFAAANDISPASFNSAAVIMYDRACLGDEPYELAKSGEWTLEKLLELTKAQGGITLADVDSAESLLLASGAKFVSEDADGNPSLAPLTAETLDAADIIGELLGLELENTSLTVATLGDVQPSLSGGLYGSDLRVLPLPKLDAADEYVTPITDDYDVLAIPVLVSETDKVATVLNTLQYHAHELVLPAEVRATGLAKTGYIAEVREGVELARESLTFDKREICALPSLYAENLASVLENGNLVSTLVMQEQKAQKSLDRFAEALDELREMGR